MNFGPMFLAHLWQTTLFAFAVWLVNVLLLRDNRAQTRFALWFAASVKFLVPFAALTAPGGRLGWFRHGKAVADTGMIHVFNEVSQRVATAPLAPVRAAATATATSNWGPAVLLGVWICGVADVALSWWLRSRLWARQLSKPPRSAITAVSKCSPRRRCVNAGWSLVSAGGGNP